jgi:hypothetical protein
MNKLKTKYKMWLTAKLKVYRFLLPYLPYTKRYHTFEQTNELPNKIRKSILLILLITFSCQHNNERTKAIEYLQNVAELTNKTEKLPRKVDENTIAEKVTYDSDKRTITYSYILTDIRPDIENISEVIDSLKAIEINQIKRAKQNQGNDKAYDLLQVTINSVYKDSKGNEFYTFKIKPEQYLAWKYLKTKKHLLQ